MFACGGRTQDGTFQKRATRIKSKTEKLEGGGEAAIPPNEVI